ncbi:MAG: glycosyltransferase family 2 protein [Candidatus Bathyarchaeota archaeon]|nr:MAG: glycosyltransferase family 2 protein [Candidatus Bathyarchaeota archaeon]
MASRRVLVTIPAYNEEKTVADVVKSTLELHPEFEIVVIDDGSEDATAQRARNAGADVVSLPFHCGGSVAIQTGYIVAAQQHYDYAVKIDGDGQHKPEEISKLLNPLINGEADLTVGSRYLSVDSEDRSMVKEGGRVFSSALVSLLRRIDVTDVTSGMRAWSQKSIQTLLPIYLERRYIEDSVFWIVETLLAAKKGLRMKEVPIEVYPRKYGKSKSFSPSAMLVYPLRLIATMFE